MEQNSSEIGFIGSLHNLPKHNKYKNMYKPFDYYWGLGIEHETYIQTSVYNSVPSFMDRMAPDRYSVSYYNAYKKEALNKAINTVGSVIAPMLINAYAMTNTDLFGEHKTLYVRGSPPNPAFNGKTIFEWMTEHSEWFLTQFERSFVWDGDTVEFITQDFYKVTVDRVIAELASIEDRFGRELHALPYKGIIKELGPLHLVEQNEPWAVYSTNRNNVAMFNNGTIHINATLPTRLDWYCRPMWRTDFVDKHRRLARLIQWIEPLWIALYGSPDPFTRYPSLRTSFAAGSQRLAVSRYIGLGTFDTNTMATGKILQIQKKDMPWYDALHAKTEYAPLDVIGLDINFNKHWAHGIEIRIFDQIPLVQIREIMTHVVALMDASLAMKTVMNPRDSLVWQQMATESIYSGPEMVFEPIMLNTMWAAFGLKHESKEPLDPDATMALLMSLLAPLHGYCWEHIVNGKQSRCWP